MLLFACWSFGDQLEPVNPNATKQARHLLELLSEIEGEKTLSGQHNFNVFGDPIAARTLIHLPMPLVLFDTGGHLSCPMEESARAVRPFGEIGEYLHEFRKTHEWFAQPDKGFFDLGDIAALLAPEIATWVVEDCPEVSPDLRYRFKGSKGKILRCSDIDRDKTFALLYERLRKAYPPEGS